MVEKEKLRNREKERLIFGAEKLYFNSKIGFNTQNRWDG